jgi:hypothetical protein
MSDGQTKAFEQYIHINSNIESTIMKFRRNSKEIALIDLLSILIGMILGIIIMNYLL